MRKQRNREVKYVCSTVYLIVNDSDCWMSLLFNSLLVWEGKIYILFCMLSHFSRIWLSATPWTVAHQAPLSMGILQVRILELVAMPSSRGSSPHCPSTKPSTHDFPGTPANKWVGLQEKYGPDIGFWGRRDLRGICLGEMHKECWDLSRLWGRWDDRDVLASENLRRQQSRVLTYILVVDSRTQPPQCI